MNMPELQVYPDMGRGRNIAQGDRALRKVMTRFGQRREQGIGPSWEGIYRPYGLMNGIGIDDLKK